MHLNKLIINNFALYTIFFYGLYTDIAVDIRVIFMQFDDVRVKTKKYRILIIADKKNKKGYNVSLKPGCV